MTEYVVGFAFIENDSGVFMIRKKRPIWQKGYLNGIGGKVKGDGESHWTAMTREFAEEAGVFVPEPDWKHVLTVAYPVNGAMVYFFKTILPRHLANDVKTMTDEKIELWTINCLCDLDGVRPPMVRNLSWILPFVHLERPVAPPTVLLEMEDG